jgi:O-methyltransferase involved in polyketide biosynthesis
MRRKIRDHNQLDKPRLSAASGPGQSGADQTAPSLARPDQPGPSQTALTSAAARAAHLIVDDPPVIFADTLAMTVLGDQATELVDYHRAHGTHLVLSAARGQVTCRSRHTEEHLAAAVSGGVTQYVLLGAGLDTFAYRSALAGRVRVRG